MNDSATRSIAPAALCIGTSIAFIAMGGAFLVGVMLLVRPSLFVLPEALEAPIADPEALERLELILYAATGTCFAVGMGALFLAFRKLP